MVCLFPFGQRILSGTQNPHFSQAVTTANAIRVYVAVKADFSENSKMIPREIAWEDGSKYEIDRVLDVRQAATMKAGGRGDRHTVRISIFSPR